MNKSQTEINMKQNMMFVAASVTPIARRAFSANVFTNSATEIRRPRWMADKKSAIGIVRTFRLLPKKVPLLISRSPRTIIDH
jgi:hypothetical protein